MTLRRGDTIYASEKITVSSDYKEVTLNKTLANCSQTGTFKIRVQNTGSNPQQGEAEFLPFNPPLAEKRNLTLMNAPYTLMYGPEYKFNLGSFTRQGTITLKVKWHTPLSTEYLTPTYESVYVELLRPDNSEAFSCQSSIHAPSDQPWICNRTYTVTQADTLQTGKWKVSARARIETNGFDIRKGSDPNPLVPNFNSTFTTFCGQ